VSNLESEPPTLLYQRLTNDVEQQRRMYERLETNVKVAFGELNKLLDDRFHSYDESIETLNRNQKTLQCKLADIDGTFQSKLSDVNQLISNFHYEAIDRKAALMD